MALSSTPQPTPLASVLVQQTSATAVADDNVLGAAGSWYLVDIDNTANAAASYVKFYDHADPAVGTTAPNWVFQAPGTARVVYAVSTPVSVAALSFCAVTTPGTAGTTSPTSACIVRIMADV